MALFSLWLYATLRQVGSARALGRRCQADMACQWLCGGVTLNSHTLADFRTDHGAVLDQLLTTSVAVLLDQELVTRERVAGDGMRVRASAGASSDRLARYWKKHFPPHLLCRRLKVDRDSPVKEEYTGFIQRFLTGDSDVGSA